MNNLNKTITSIELQKILGKELHEVLRMDVTPEERAVIVERSKQVIGFSNQIINNANFVLNGEKHLAAINDLKKSVIKDFIGVKDVD